ncbi:CHAT domain-containing protein [Nostoc sp. TCL26-01]|uniref:CHAT domain-containing protein n=1 Tax=Nostoc sp. TCL26-01 TaxID=2576904 RepID=UPI0015B9DE85|nr:CHAT domain-containing protein [Nostoc sp. TCL26-01]QLE57340.1 CHAT domain-containing protein [Nostoc sp. TCL26-01]
MFNQGLKSFTASWLALIFFVSLTFFIWLGNLHSENLVNAQATDAVQLVNRGVASYQTGDFQDAIQAWQSALNIYQKNKSDRQIAIVRENLARAYQQVGNVESALSYWEQLIADYRSQNNGQKVGRSLTEIAQIYSGIGQTKKAINLLCGVTTTPLEKLDCQTGSAIQIASEQKDQQGKIAALGSVGEAYRLKGNYGLAIAYLLAAQHGNNQIYSAAIFNSLGNAYASRAQLWNLRANSAQQQGIVNASKFQENSLDDYRQAEKYLQLSIAAARQQNDKTGELRSLLNLAKLAYRSQNSNLAQENIQQALAILNKSPDAINKIYATIDLANLFATGTELISPLTQCPTKGIIPDVPVRELLNQAINIAQKIQDSRSESYALGAMGHFYECHQAYQQAWELTQKAIWVADQKLQAKDSLYLWEWQAARILQNPKQNQPSQALLFYQRAYHTLEQLRSDILIADRDFQFDFRDIVEPIYRQLAQIQLELATANVKSSQKSSTALDSALETINSLRVAEIQNYFGNDCIIASVNNQNTDQTLNQETVVISSIILDDKTGILISLPNQEKHLHWLLTSKEKFKEEISNFRQGIIAGQETFIYDTTQAEKLYDLIIRPLEQYFNPEQIKTLVFVPDGFLRNLPLAALYDKIAKKYLIQKYAIATIPSLQLTTAKQRSLQSSKALVLAVTQEAKIDEQIFPKLTSVPLEIQAIQKEFPEYKKLENQDFITDKLAKEIKNTTYPIIHIATHAQFGIIPEDTFLVTGDNNKLTINQLEILLRQSSNTANSVELLALTACETAVGDDRATLGLAGVALQAGAKSAMASLWPVGDDSTADIVAEFYHNLRKSGMSKAQALQAAQVKLINAQENEINDQYTHPYYWAPFIMIGNWL